jgi:hypothetical protein
MVSVAVGILEDCAVRVRFGRSVLQVPFFLRLLSTLTDCQQTDYPNHCELKHREYLQNPKLFKEAVPIKDAATLGRIHLNFRLTYLKDVVMARWCSRLRDCGHSFCRSRCGSLHTRTPFQKF